MLNYVFRPLVPRVMFTDTTDPRLGFYLALMEQAVLESFDYRIIFDKEDQVDE